MIRREGHDPLHYTISRRGKKQRADAATTASAAAVWDGGREYADGLLVYRSEGDELPDEDYSSTVSEEEVKYDPSVWQSVIRYGPEDKELHPAARGSVYCFIHKRTNPHYVITFLTSYPLIGDQRYIFLFLAQNLSKKR